MAGNRGINNYQNMSEEKLLHAILKYDRFVENLSQNGLERIARMQNLSQKEPEQIPKMQDLLQNELEQIVKTRRIKRKICQRKIY